MRVARDPFEVLARAVVAAPEPYATRLRRFTAGTLRYVAPEEQWSRALAWLNANFPTAPNGPAWAASVARIVAGIDGESN